MEDQIQEFEKEHSQKLRLTIKDIICEHSDIKFVKLSSNQELRKSVLIRNSR